MPLAKQRQSLQRTRAVLRRTLFLHPLIAWLFLKVLAIGDLLIFEVAMLGSAFPQISSGKRSGKLESVEQSASNSSEPALALLFQGIREESVF